MKTKNEKQKIIDIMRENIRQNNFDYVFENIDLLYDFNDKILSNNIDVLKCNFIDDEKRENDCQYCECEKKCKYVVMCYCENTNDVYHFLLYINAYIVK